MELRLVFIEGFFYSNCFNLYYKCIFLLLLFFIKVLLIKRLIYFVGYGGNVWFAILVDRKI